MALTKIINDGDELVFDISHIAHGARKEISIIHAKRARPANILIIRADPSISIKHIRLDKSEEPVEKDKSGRLPVYRCHKLVQAALITQIDLHGTDDSLVSVPTATLMFGLIQQSVQVDEHFILKHLPKVGSYYVVYEDGYCSISPAHAFETGYLPA